MLDSFFLQACFVVSGDKYFSEKGNVTGIAYRTRYFKFKLLLEDSLESGETHTLKTLAFWDQQLFSSGDGLGERFDFSDSAEVDEMAAYRRAVLQSRTSQATPLPNSSVSPLSHNATPQVFSTALGSQSSSHPPIRSNITVIEPSVSFRPPTLQTPLSAFSASHTPVPANSSALVIAASQPRSNIIADSATDSDSDNDHPSPTRSSTPTQQPLVPESPFVNHSTLVEQFNSHMNLVEKQPSVPPLANATVTTGVGSSSDHGAKSQPTR